VPALTHDDVRDLYAVRTPLELMVVAKIVDQRLAPPEAEQAVRRLERLTDRSRWADTVDIDCAFHMALVASINSPRLTRIYRSLQGEIRLALLQLGPAHQSATWMAAEHRKLLEAITQGPKRRAIETMTRHLDSTVTDITGAA
jgi:DNA-binding GntR family transcriptional regulator